MVHCDGCENVEEGKKCIDCTELEYGAYALQKAIEMNNKELGCNNCKLRGTEGCMKDRKYNEDGPTCEDFRYCGSTLTNQGWD